MQYIILDNQKRATHDFKDGVGAKTWDEVKDFDNIGLIVPKPIIILDFDTKEDAEIMLKIVDDLEIKCKVMQTNRGYHFWFKSEDPWKCFKKTRLACGIFSDCKSHSKNAYVKIKSDGVMRPWIRRCKAEEIEPVPAFLRPVGSPTDKFSFKGMKDGDGRNQELFNYIVYLQSKGFKKQAVLDTIRVINECVFADPLSDAEIATICRDDAFKSDEEMDKQIAEAKVGKFSHSEFGDALIEEYRIITVGAQIYIYEDGYYQQDERIIENKMIEMWKDIKQQQRAEVLAYIRIKTHVPREKLKIDPYIVNLQNTRLNLRTGNLLPFDPEAIEFARVPVTYDPTAYNADLDKMLNRVFCGDREVIDLFGEMVGYCLLKNLSYQKGFMFYGSGSNGKSTILDLIKKFLGYRNISSIELDKLTATFNTAELENKLANIGDDVNDIPLKDTGTLKKLFSGESLQVQRKGERPFDFASYATPIFSCNSIPRSYDKTEGLYRRWIFIPFTAKFRTTDEDYDPLIKDKIMTDNALSYLLNIAVEGINRLMTNKCFTESESVRKVFEDYTVDNSTVLSWIADKEIPEDYFLEKCTDELYFEFATWCKDSGIRQVTGKKGFYREVSAKYDFDDFRPQKRVNGKIKRYFMQKIDD
ncbi:MAG: phage/plasmid primase, P4 family [Parabacteroides sp.]|nr:phage/plasmid primase, P4 family [Parabacteroides sp.]